MTCMALWSLLKYKALRQNDTGFCAAARLCALLALKFKVLRQNDTEFCEVARLLALNHIIIT